MQLNTLSELEERKAQREKTISKYMDMLNELKTKRKNAEAERETAIINGDIEKVAELSKLIQDIGFQKDALIDVINSTKAQPICTDSDIIQIANKVLAKYKPTISKLNERFSKLANDICSAYKDLAVTYEKVYEEQRNVLLYHSAQQTVNNGNARDCLFISQGLEELEPMPQCNDLFGLLNKQYGVIAETLRAISNGVQMTGFRG